MPIIDCWIHDYRPLVRCKVSAGGPTLEVTALLDTGATECTVTPAVASAIGLAISGSRILHTVGASGSSAHGQAIFSFQGPVDENGFTAWRVESMTFVKSLSPEYQAIIGMNVVSQGRLTIDGDFISFAGPRRNGMGLATA